MRLLNVHTLQLEEFFKDEPPYTILSHTWGDEEVSFQDLSSGAAENLKGYQKLLGCCSKSAEEGFDYTWIDTCCIDKTSSAELSEAINSMFLWYAKSKFCYSFLSDVSFQAGDNIDAEGSNFAESRWFKRGWTLQELLAPENVVFFDRGWTEIGTKISLGTTISRITGIEPLALNYGVCHVYGYHRCGGFSVAQKMAWAALRETTREEDEAYCLLGLFQVNMPLLYGEGRFRAFVRLQTEIVKSSDDDSIFAFVDDGSNRGLLARSPFTFCGSAMISSPSRRQFLDGAPKIEPESLSTFELKKNQITLSAPLIQLGSSPITAYQLDFDGKTTKEEPYLPIRGEAEFLVVLSCSFTKGRVAIILYAVTIGRNTFYYRPAEFTNLLVVDFADCKKLPPPQKISIMERGAFDTRICAAPSRAQADDNGILRLIMAMSPVLQACCDSRWPQLGSNSNLVSLDNLGRQQQLSVICPQVVLFDFAFRLPPSHFPPICRDSIVTPKQDASPRPRGLKLHCSWMSGTAMVSMHPEVLTKIWGEDGDYSVSAVLLPKSNIDASNAETASCKFRFDDRRSLVIKVRSSSHMRIVYMYLGLE